MGTKAILIAQNKVQDIYYDASTPELRRGALKDIFDGHNNYGWYEGMDIYDDNINKWYDEIISGDLRHLEMFMVARSGHEYEGWQEEHLFSIELER